MVSVNAILTVLRVAGAEAEPGVFSSGPMVGFAPSVIFTLVTVPTTKSAAVIVALAVESAVPCSYRRLRSFS